MRRPLHFDEASHTYTVDGVALPSVSKIIAPLVSFDGVDPVILAGAAARGKAVHKACELDDVGDLDEATVDEIVAPYLQAWRLFAAENGAVVIDTEAPRYHDSLRFAGTRDSRLSIRGKVWLIDRKTSAPAHWHSVQVAGYQVLAENNREPVDYRGAVYLQADGKYRFVPYNDPTSIRCFAALLTVHQWKASHG